MKKIKEQEFLQMLVELKGKTVIVKLEGETQGKMVLEKMKYEIPYKSNVVTISDNRNNNNITIDLSISYKITANGQNKALQVYCDNEVVYTIEKMK